MNKAFVLISAVLSLNAIAKPITTHTTRSVDCNELRQTLRVYPFNQKSINDAIRFSTSNKIIANCVYPELKISVLKTLGNSNDDLAVTNQTKYKLGGMVAIVSRYESKADNDVQFSIKKNDGGYIVSAIRDESLASSIESGLKSGAALLQKNYYDLLNKLDTKSLKDK